MANGAHLSHSQISCLLKCPRQYYFRYIERIKTPASASLLLGTAYHAGIERNFVSKAKTGHDLETAEVLDAYERSWNQRLAEEEVDWQDTSPGEVKDTGAGLLCAYMETCAPFVMPREVERRFSVDLPDVPGYTLDGIIDLVTTDGVIVDHKTSGKSWTDDAAAKELQPYGYAAALLTDPALDEVRFCFHVAVKLKTPKVQMIEVTRNRADAEWFLALAGEAVKQIRAGIFPCNPTGWWCDRKWCGYYDRCKGGAR